MRIRAARDALWRLYEVPCQRNLSFDRELAKLSHRCIRHGVCFCSSVVKAPRTTETEAAHDADPDAAEDSTEEVFTSAQPTLPYAAPYVPRTKRWALVGVVLTSFALAAWVAAPLWVPILLGVIMAVTTQRAFHWLLRTLGLRRATWAAALLTLATGGLVATVGTLVLLALTNELMKIVAHLDRAETGSLAFILGARGERVLGSVGLDPDRVYAWVVREIDAAASYAATLAALVLRTTSFAVLGLVVSLMTMYYVLLEGPRLARRIERVAPLEPRHTRALLFEAREVGRTAFLGTVVTALVQGVLSWIGYAALGVPQALTWAILTALGSFLPVIGTAIVWVPVAGWLVIHDEPIRALLLVVYGLLIITSLADYVIRPRLVGQRGHSHPLLTLIALLGGLEVFGLAGLVVAPIVTSVFVAAFRIYEREIPRRPIPVPH